MARPDGHALPFAAMDELPSKLRTRLGLADPVPVPCRRGEGVQAEGYTRERIEYAGLEGDVIPAFLFLPAGRAPVGGVVAYHQHNGQFHFGKSEVAGLAGDPFLAFGPALARQGVAVLAPDALTFEDRRAGVRGTEPDTYDWLQHYNAMSYRLLAGDVLMRKGLDDAQRALGVLLQVAGVDPRRAGVIGHSFGGTTAMYHAVVDDRVRFACLSGAVCSFGTRLRAGTGILLFETVPGLAQWLDTHDLLAAIGPRPVMVVSGTQDKYSRDADAVVANVGGDFIEHLRVDRGHALDQERFEAMVAWTVARVAAP